MDYNTRLPFADARLGATGPIEPHSNHTYSHPPTHPDAMMAAARARPPKEKHSKCKCIFYLTCSGLHPVCSYYRVEKDHIRLLNIVLFLGTAMKEFKNDEHLSRDEKRARSMNLPMSTDDIINLPMDEFNERLSKYDLTETQLSLIRDIRRRGKNKVKLFVSLSIYFVSNPLANT